MRGLNFHVEGLKIEVGLTTEVEGLSPPRPLALTTAYRRTVWHVNGLALQYT